MLNIMSYDTVNFFFCSSSLPTEDVKPFNMFNKWGREEL